jgi:mannose-6-phosphate isomerase-like protein (cupin superfamily)
MPEETIFIGDLLALLQDGRSGPVWSWSSDELNINLLHFDHGDGVAAHVNREVDVLGIVIAGEGVIVVNGAFQLLRPGMAFCIPKGAERALRSAGGPFTYVSCHRRRAGLMPTRAPRG